MKVALNSRILHRARPERAEQVKVAVVIPCYRVREHVLDVIAQIPVWVKLIICVDDACPEGTGNHIEEHTRDPRVVVIFHDENKGVGGATKTGYLQARARGAVIAVKLDGDGQMNPALMANFVAPVIEGAADYTKGNRFFSPDDARGMPTIRLFGNAILSFIAKLSTGYWNIFDPTNGYTALHLGLLDIIRLDKVSNRYFFESDLLFRLNIARMVVMDIPMKAVYESEVSGLRVGHVLLSFLGGNLKNFCKRIFYNYFLRDFQVASVEFLLGPCMLVVGALFGGYNWWLSLSTGVPATAGTAIIAALMVVLGTQFTLSALSFDARNVPTEPMHLWLVDEDWEDHTLQTSFSESE